MKLRLILKIATITSVALLCIGFAISLYFKMNTVGRVEDFDLYTLVPVHSRVIVDTDNMVELIGAVNDLSSSKDHHFLYVSHLFSDFKDHINTLLDEAPHGLSKQMNKMLISFHEPDNDRNQIFYCKLGAGDYEFVERFMKKYCASAFPSKFFDYKGEEIRIYPMPDDSFLACYFTSEFLAISYQKKLIEGVIDAYLSGESILSDQTFAKIRDEKRTTAPATIYVRMDSVGMGKATDGIPSHTSLGFWTEFNMNVHPDAIYFTGVNYDPDSCMTFMNVLRKQMPIEGFPGDVVPASTFFFNKQSISDLQHLFEFTSSHEYTKATYSNYIMERDRELFYYLQDNASHSITTCMFENKDTLSNPHVVVTVPLKSGVDSERSLESLLRTMPREEDIKDIPSTIQCNILSNKFILYAVPRNTLFTQLTGITGTSLHTYVCFYKGQMLISPDESGIRTYIVALEKNEVLEHDSMYVESTQRLSQSYNYMMMADLGNVFEQPESYVRLIPHFFFRNQEFFRHFVLSTQFSCVDNVVYPNVVLCYKRNM